MHPLKKSKRDDGKQIRTQEGWILSTGTTSRQCLAQQSRAQDPDNPSSPNCKMSEKLLVHGLASSSLQTCMHQEKVPSISLLWASYSHLARADDVNCKVQKSNRLCDGSISTSHFLIASITIAIRLFTPASDLHPWSCITNPREREREILQGHVNCKVQKSNRLCDQSISTSNFQIAPITIAIRVFTPAQICIHSPACITNQRERER